MHNNKLSTVAFRIFNLLIGILSGLFWILVLFSFDDAVTAFTTLLAAAIHELGHEIALLILKKQTRIPIPRLLGLKITPSGVLSYKQEVIVCAAGPLANLAASLISLPLSLLCVYFSLFSAVNFITAASNLFPIKSYDGYKIISALSAAHSQTGEGWRILDRISLAFATAVLFLSLYAIYRLDAGYWIFGVFFIFLIREVKNTV